jgi:hypothetical protein
VAGAEPGDDGEWEAEYIGGIIHGYVTAGTGGGGPASGTECVVCL